MKNIFLTVVFLMFSIESFSQVAPAEELKQASCSKIEKSCTTAGFHLGGFKDKKGLFSDCYNLILKNKKVAKVKVDKKDILDCDKYRMNVAITTNVKEIKNSKFIKTDGAVKK